MSTTGRRPIAPLRRWTTRFNFDLERFGDIPRFQARHEQTPNDHQGGEYHRHETYNAWNKCSELLCKRDTENVAAWTAEVDSLLTFSGLLLTVVTLFIGTASQTLQPDNAGLTVQVLVAISQQLHNSTVAGATSSPFILPEFASDKDDVIMTSLLSTSLLVSLIASGMGLWVKEWLREYSLDLPYRARELVHVREYRHHGLAKWRMRTIASSISIMLMLAVTLFGIGLTMMTMKLNTILTWVMTGSLVVWTILVWSTAILPTFSTHCPFKSPFARMIYRVRHLRIVENKDGRLRWRKFESMVDRERKKANEQGTDLELRALIYVNDEYWGSDKLLKINKCFRDVKDTRKARKAIEEIVATRVWGCHDEVKLAKRAETDGAAMTALPTDEDVLYLLEIWDSIGVEGEPEPPRTNGDLKQQRWERFMAVVGVSRGRDRSDSVTSYDSCSKPEDAQVRVCESPVN